MRPMIKSFLTGFSTARVGSFTARTDRYNSRLSSGVLLRSSQLFCVRLAKGVLARFSCHCESSITTQVSFAPSGTYLEIAFKTAGSVASSSPGIKPFIDGLTQTVNPLFFSWTWETKAETVIPGFSWERLIGTGASSRDASSSSCTRRSVT